MRRTPPTTVKMTYTDETDDDYKCVAVTDLADAQCRESRD
jgi:hypothetical protein